MDRKHCVVAVVGLCGLLLPAVSSAQQTPSVERWFQRGTVMIGAGLGGAAFSDFRRSMARPLAAPSEPAFERRVSASTSGAVGGWVALWLSQRWGVRAGATYASSAFTVRNEEGQATFGRSTTDLEPQYAGLRVMLADAAVLFRAPMTFGRVAPYALAGGGLVRYWRSPDGELPAEARARFDGGAWTGLAGLLGVGAAVPLEKRDLMLVFELTDHISRTPLGGRASSEPVDDSGIALQLDPTDVAGADRVGIVNNIKLMVGVVLPIR